MAASEDTGAAGDRALDADALGPDVPGDGPADDETLLGERRGRVTAEKRARRSRRSRAVILVVAAVTVVAVATGVAMALAQPRDVVQMVEPTATTPSPPEATTPPPAESTPPAETLTPSPTPPPSSPATPTTGGNLSVAGDFTDPSSITVLVNKLTPLEPVEYEPADLVPVASLGIPSMNGHSLRAEAAGAVQTMFAAASAAGYSLDMTSGYRSSGLQSQLYDGYVAELGQAGADATSARPGYSEHQTGLAADISAPDAGCVLEACFGTTAEGQWLAANAWQYGFILRYPEGLTNVTGYEYEPWHFRYVGTEVATSMHEQGIATYEEFLGQPAAPDYAS